MFRAARQILQLVTMLGVLLSRWSRGRNRAPYLSTVCLVVVLVGAVALMAICCLAALLFVALLFMKGAFL